MNQHPKVSEETPFGAWPNARSGPGFRRQKPALGPGTLRCIIHVRVPRGGGEVAALPLISPVIAVVSTSWACSCRFNLIRTRRLIWNYKVKRDECRVGTI